MKDKDSVGMKEQRLKRQRVNRIKKMIIVYMAFGFLAMIAFCIGLSIQVVRLNHRVDTIAEEVVAVEAKGQPDDYNSASAGGDQVLSQGPDEARQEPLEPSGDEAADPSGDVQEPAEPSGDAQEPGQDTGELQEPADEPEDDVKRVYLTFDDGPSSNTAAVLDILKEKNVKATFFVIGNEQDYASEMYRRIVEEGHTLGMHSYTHKYSTIYESLDAFKEDFYHLRDYLTEVTGVTPTVMRFPGGSSNNVSNIDMKECIRFLNEEGVAYYDWNVVSGDATSQIYTPDELIANVVQDVVKYKTSVVLMHDAETKGTTVEALGPMIDQLRGMGYEMLPIDGNTKPVQHIKADSVE